MHNAFAGILRLELLGGQRDQLSVLGNVFIGPNAMIEVFLDFVPSLIDLENFFTASLPVFDANFFASTIFVFTGDPNNVGASIDVGFSNSVATLTTQFGTSAQVPEPSTLVIFAIGLAGLDFTGWRTRREHQIRAV